MAAFQLLYIPQVILMPGYTKAHLGEKSRPVHGHVEFGHILGTCPVSVGLMDPGKSYDPRATLRCVLVFSGRKGMCLLRIVRGD